MYFGRKKLNMNTRRLGKTGLQVSEVGFGGEWLERHPEEEGVELIRYASSKGINILDCLMVYPGAYRIYLEERPVFPHQGYEICASSL